MYSKMLWGQKRLHCDTLGEVQAVITVHYWILFASPTSERNNMRYGIVVEQERAGEKDRCIFAPFTNDMQAVKRLLELLHNNDVLPVHVPEIWQDLYGTVPVLLQ